MKQQITITWNENNLEETKVTYSEGWEVMQEVAKLDCICDAIHTLVEKAEKVSDDFYRR